MTKRFRQTLDVLFLVIAVPTILFWAVGNISGGDVGFGILLIFVAGVVLWGVGGSVLRSWTGYEPGRQYVLGAVFVFGGMGAFSLEAAIAGDNAVHTALSGLAAAILIPAALYFLYGWIKAGPMSETDREGDA